MRPGRTDPGRPLPAGARVGTGSPRRAAQLLAPRPDLRVEPVRGNVDTRLRLVSDGDVDAVVLAVAGLARLGRTGAITETFGPEVMLPAPAQGALAVECRAGDLRPPGTRRLCRHSTTADAGRRRSPSAACWPRLEAGCIAPVGAYATVTDGTLTLRGRGGGRRRRRRWSRGERTGPVGDATGDRAGPARWTCSSRGAADLLGAATVTGDLGRRR